MKIKAHLRDGLMIVEVEGRLDVNTSPEFLEEMGALKSLPTVLDMGALTYISSAGLRALHVLKKSRERLAVANFTGFCKEIYDVSGFTSVVPEHPTVDDAAAALTS